MQELTGKQYSQRDSHVDMSQACSKRDKRDSDSLCEFLDLMNPFDESPLLRNIVTGVTGDEKLTVMMQK
jgi:hypothetical protein